MPDLTQQLAEGSRCCCENAERCVPCRCGNHPFCERRPMALASFRDSPHRHQQADKQGEGR